MKRLWPILASFLLLTACAASKPSSAGPQPAEPPAVSVPATADAGQPEVPQEPAASPKEPEEVLIFSVVSKKTSESTRSGSVVVLSSSVEIPVLKVLRADGEEVSEAHSEKEREALKAAETFNGTFSAIAEEMQLGYEEMEADAQMRFEQAEGTGDVFAQSTQSFSFSHYRLGTLISIAGAYDCFAGGPHPTSSCFGWNFDCATGTFLSVPALATDSLTFRSAVADEILTQCRKTAEECGMTAGELFWEDYEQIVSEWDSYAVSFDKEGMKVVFSVYEIAPYAAGEQTFRFSYEWLRPYLGEIADVSIKK